MIWYNSFKRILHHSNQKWSENHEKNLLQMRKNRIWKGKPLFLPKIRGNQRKFANL